MSGFHEVRFPVDIGIRSKGGPERRTDIVTLGSGREERNARWAHSRRRYDAGYGVRSQAALSAVVSFFEERRGRLHGFRFKDRLDFRSTFDGTAPGFLDQIIGLGTGVKKNFSLVKTYGTGDSSYVRKISKPVAGTVKIAVSGIHKLATTHYSIDHVKGEITFVATQVPLLGQSVTAGFEFDVPVRFDTDRLDVDFASFDAGEILSVPLVELVP
jgi:uncharacterized protein (TIGR02217 family)